VGPKPSWKGLRVFWALLSIGFAGPVVGAVVALASGATWPPLSPNDAPLRLGMVIGFAALAGAFASATIGSILAWRAGPKRSNLGAVLLPFGLTILAAAMAPIVATLPPERGHSPAPAILLVPLYVGLGVLLLGLAWAIAPALRDGIRRRDPLPFLALALLAGLFILLRSRP
jgi:hypothetical protein